MNKQRIIMVAMLVFTLVALALAGCTKGKEESDAPPGSASPAAGVTAGKDKLPKVEYVAGDPLGGLKLPLADSPVKLTMIAPDGDMYKKDSWILTQEIKKKLNLDIDLTKYGTTYIEKLKLLIATNNLPDIVTAVGDYATINKLATANMLLPLDNYLNIMPNFRNYLEKNPQIRNDLTAIDGHFYNTAFEGFYAPLGISSAWVYRQDVFKKYNIEPKFATIDEFYDTLLKIRDASPGNYPIINRGNGQRMISYFSGAFNTGESIYYSDANGKWQYGPVEPNYKEILQLLNKMQNDKLLHPEWAANDGNAMLKLIWSDPYAGGAVLPEAPTWAGKPTNELNFTYDVFLPPKPNVPGGAQKMYVNGLIQTQNTGISVSAKTKNPEAIMKFIDYMYSDEGTLWLFYGAEGLTYKKNAQGALIPIGGDGTGNHDDYIKAIITQYGFGSRGFFARMPPEALKEPKLEQIKVDAQMRLKPSMKLNSPKINLDPLELDYVTTTMATITKFAQESAMQFATGKKPFGEWDSYVAKLKEMGIDSILDMYNKAWAKQKGN
ncbi:MAG: extracellular solute-binding protein [Paenibacillaceae bacterium]|nr:extracellular solute-binding protein [Paenibacillaceae bacterium]